jgi:hypothetical protein
MEFSLLSPSAGDNLASIENRKAKVAAVQSYDIREQTPTRPESLKRPRDRHMMDESTHSQRNRDSRSLERQACQELKVFRRIHLQTMEDFTKSYVCNSDKSHFERFDIAHVQSKFPGASTWICRRAGQGITKRRHILARFAEAEHARANLDISRLANNVYDHDKGQQLEESETTHMHEESDQITYTTETPNGAITSTETYPDGFSHYLRLPLPHLSLNVSSGENTISKICSICFRQQDIASIGAWRYVLNVVVIL